MNANTPWTLLLSLFAFILGSAVALTVNTLGSELDADTVRAIAHEQASKTAPDDVLAASEVRELVADQLDDNDLTGDARDKHIEKILLDFIKSRARQPGRTDNKGNQSAQGAGGPGGQVAKSGSQSNKDNLDIDPIDTSKEPVVGNEDARYQFIIYADYECPFCKRFFPTADKIREEYGDSLAITMRDAPMRSHGQAAINEAIAARCVNGIAGSEAYWDISRAIYDATGANGKGLPDDRRLLDMAVEAGAAAGAFSKCMDENADEIREFIDDSTQSARRLGINGTPTSVILDTQSGRTIKVRGARPLSDIRPALDRLTGKNTGDSK